MSSFQKICNLIILSVFILEIIPITPALAVVDEGSNISTNITTNTPTTTSTTKSSTQKTVYKQRPTETTFLYIQNATNVSESFQTWAKEIDQLDERIRQVDEDLRTLVAVIPNIPDPQTHYGKDEHDNQVIQMVGEPRTFNFNPLPHWDLGPTLGVLDFDREIGRAHV